MTIGNTSNLINQICSASGLKGKDLDALKARLEKLSETELQAELFKALSGENLSEDMGLVVERTQQKDNNSNLIHNVANENILPANQGKEVTCQIIDENLREAFGIFDSQHLGSISGSYDEKKSDDDILKSSNVAKILDYQKSGLIQIVEAKNNNLTRREYYEENKQRIKDMILTRLNVLKTSTGASYIDAFKGEYSKEEMSEIINAYIERLCSDASMEDLKKIQKQFVSYNQVEETEALGNFVKNAKDFDKNCRDTEINSLGNEGPKNKIKGLNKGIIPSYWDSDLPISFEEVYKLERGTEYSQFKVEKYLQTKAEMETVINAHNKKQQFVDFTESLIKEDVSYEEKEEKLLAGFASYYAISDDGGLSQLQKIIDKSTLPVFIENGKLNLDAYPDDESKKRVLNSILKIAGQEKEKEFKAFLGDKSIEEYQLSFENATNEVLGEENGKLLADAMVSDNMGMIKRYTGNASMAGMALTVVGGVLCFTPAAPLGATLVTAGNTIAISGMAAKTGLGVADYVTKDVQTQEEFEGLAKDFIMDAGGFIIGMKAGQAGMKVFSKLIDKKLVAVFGEQISQGNRAQALKTLFSNPEYLKSFMTAGGAKIGTDFMISYLGDLAMMGVLDTQDDWKSLLQANLTGILVGMSGDIKDAAGVGKLRTTRSTDLQNNKLDVEIDNSRTNLSYRNSVSADNAGNASDLLLRLSEVDTRKDFVSIRDEIKKLPNGEEKNNLIQAYLKKYNSWSANPARPDIIMEYKQKPDLLNQDSEEIRTMRNNYLTKLRQTSRGEDITIKLNGEEHVYQAYKGNITNNGSYQVSDGENLYSLDIKLSENQCKEEILANDLYSEFMGCYSKEKEIVEVDNRFAVLSKSVFQKNGFQKNKDAVSATYAMDALLGNMENVVTVPKNGSNVVVANNLLINLLHMPDGRAIPKKQIVQELALMFEKGQNADILKKASKQDIISSLEKVVNISDERLLELVNNSSVDEKDVLGRLLIGRKNFIAHFLENLKNTEQEGLPIEVHVKNIYQQTYAEYSYDELNSKNNCEFTQFIAQKFDIPKKDLLGYMKFQNIPELAKYFTDKINNGVINKEDLDKINQELSFYQLFWAEKPSIQIQMLDAMLDLKKENNINYSNSYLLLLKLAQGDIAGKDLDLSIIDKIKTINSELNGNVNYLLYQRLIKNGEIDTEKLDIVKDFQQRGIDDKYLVLLLAKLETPDGKINPEKQQILESLFEENIKPEDIPLYFSAIDTPYGADKSMFSIVDKYKELGFSNDEITSYLHQSRIKTQSKTIQQTHALKIPLLFPNEIKDKKFFNDAFKEFLKWSAPLENQITRTLEKNPNVQLVDLFEMLKACRSSTSMDKVAYSMAFNLLEKGVSSKGIGYFINRSKIMPSNNLTPEEAVAQTAKLRNVGITLIENGYSTADAALLIDIAKTEGVVDDFVLKTIQDNYSKHNARELFALINYSKILPSEVASPEALQQHRQYLLDSMIYLMENKGFNPSEVCQTIARGLTLRRTFTGRYEVLGFNKNTIDFILKSAQNGLKPAEIETLTFSTRIKDNVSEFTTQEIDAKQKMMLDWSEKLLFEDNLPASSVIKFIDVASFKTKGRVGARPAVYDFDSKVVDVINKMIQEKAITSESDPNITNVILAFKTLEYDEVAIEKTIDLLKNPITLSNGKQYMIDPDSLGLFIAGSTNSDTGKFDVEKFNENVDIYILKAEHGFSIQELVLLSKLYKDKTTVDALSTAQKVTLLNKLSYASNEAIKLIQDKVIDTKDDDGNVITGNVEILNQKLISDMNIASKSIRTNFAQRQEFLGKFLSNRSRNSDTGLNDIETRIAEFDFTKYGKDGLPLKYTRDEFTDKIRDILSDLSPDEQSQLLRFHNIDLGESGFNSNPRIREINYKAKNLTNSEYKDVISELSSLLDGVSEDNILLYKEVDINAILEKCVQISSLSEAKVLDLVREFPEINLENIKQLQERATQFAEIIANSDVSNLPTPLAVRTVANEIENYNQFSDAMKEASAKIEKEYNKFIYENEFMTDNPEINKIMNGIMLGLPDVMLTVGKKQHKTHDYSVDVHTMEVLKKAINDPEYKTLSDKDRTILKFSILLHDFGKKYINPDTPDTGHEIDSADIASGIMAQFKLPATVKERILNIIKNHDWFARYNKNEWNANKISALFSSPDDYKIARIMSKADLSSINADFNYKVLGITENRTPENFSRVFDKKLENIDASYQKVYSKANIVMNSKILNPEKIPMDEKYGVRVLNLADDSIPADMDLGQYGMNGTTKNNLRLSVHMVDPKNLLGNLESAKLGMESTINDNNVWSLSLIKLNRTRTYMYREYGFVTDVPLSNIAIASPKNLSSGYEKGADKFVELLFSETPLRNFLKQKFAQSIQLQGYRMTDADYQALSKQVYNKSFISQLESKSEIELNGKIYPTSVMVKAIQDSTDALFTGDTHIELVATNPKIQGLVARKSSMSELSPDFISFAKKYNLPIILVGNK